jgi:hypothetical protein
MAIPLKRKVLLLAMVGQYIIIDKIFGILSHIIIDIPVCAAIRKDKNPK